jgi:hypothetical protein
MQKLTIFIEGDRLLGAGWDIYIANWEGYRFDGVAPARIPSVAADLQAFNASIIVYRVVVDDGTQDGGPLIDPSKITATVGEFGSTGDQ